MNMVDIVIVNYFNGAELARCVQSVLVHGEGVISSVRIVNNGESDSSMLNGLTVWPLVEVIEAGANLGFSRAVNLGVSKGDAPFLCLVNPDSEFTNEWFQQATSLMENDSEIAIIAPKIINPDGSPQTNFGLFPNVKTMLFEMLRLSKLPLLRKFIPAFHLPTETIFRPQWISGSILMTKRCIFEAMGGLDETFFMYLEDVSYAKRCSEIFFKVKVIDLTAAIHRGTHKSTRTSVKYSHEAWAVYCKKEGLSLALCLIGKLSLLISSVKVRILSRDFKRTGSYES